MNTRYVSLAGAVMACFLGVLGLVHAQDANTSTTAKAAVPAAKSATASKPAAKTVNTAKSKKPVKSAKSPKKTNTAKSKSKTTTASKPASSALPVAAAAPMPAKSANPYLAHQPRNQYLPANQPANPYLAYRATSAYTPAQPDFSALMPLLPADAQKAIKENRPAKVSLSPLPVDIFMMPNQKPTVAFTTPCAMVEKATNGFPVFTAMTNFMYTMAGNINESNSLPIIIEPVCV